MKRVLPRLHLASVPELTAYDRAFRQMANPSEGFAEFLHLSVALTGFTEAELATTGLARIYFEELGLTLGIQVRRRFVTAQIAPGAMLTSSFYGPLARNLIRLWYLGQWRELPSGWVAQLSGEERDHFDEFHRNVDRVVSAKAYEEGLAWSALGTHPTGAKQAGFASWAEPPE